MSVVVPVGALPFAHAPTQGLSEPLTAGSAPESGRILRDADPASPSPDTFALACVVLAARRRGRPALTGHAAALRRLDAAIAVDELP